MRKSIRSKQMFIIFSLLFLIEFIVICIFNFAFQKNHIDYDSSVSFLCAIKMWEQKKLILTEFKYQNTLFIDSSVPLAALFYGLTKNIYIAYGLANTFINFCFIYIFYLVYKKLNLSLDSFFIALSFIFLLRITPMYSSSNELGYCNCTFIGAAFYNVKTLTSLLIIYLVVFPSKTKLNLFLSILCVLLCFVSGLSSGYWILATILTPIFLYFVYIFLLNKNKLFYKNASFIFCLICCFSLIIGKVVFTYGYGLTTIDSSMKIVSLKDLIENIISVPLGFLSLFGVLPEIDNIKFFSFKTFCFAINFIITIIFLIAIIFCIRKKYFKTNKFYLISSVIFCFDSLLFMFLKVTYGAAIFEVRYLICMFLLVCPALCFFYDNFDGRKILLGLKAKKTVFIVFPSLVAMSVACSSYSYLKNTNNTQLLASIKKNVSSIDTKLVIMYGNNLNLLSRTMRVIDSNRIYKSITNEVIDHWGDTCEFDEVSTYKGPIAFAITTQEYNKIPWYVKEEAIYKNTENNIVFFKLEKNVFDLVSGFNNNYTTNIDFIYSPNVITNSDVAANHTLLKNDTDNDLICLYGPYTKARQGNYDIELSYSSNLQGDIGTFELNCNNSTKTLYSRPIHGESQKILIENAAFSNEENFEYRIVLKPNAFLNFNKISFLRK